MVDPATLIPGTDAIPVAWGWFEFLLLLTFVLHLLFMNTMIGAAVISLVDNFRARKGPLIGSLGWDISRKLPWIIAFTVTLGVAPLLFTQVLYGQFLYTSSILMGWYWISVVGLLIVAYYSAYIYNLYYQRLGRIRVFFIGLSTVIMLFIAFIITNNMTLMLHPEKWSAYFQNSGGTLLNLSDPTLWPRYLHFIMASLAIGGLAIAILWTYRKKKGVPDADENIKRGMTWFAHSTLAEVIIGFWFFVMLPKEIMMIFMGQNLLATIVFLAGILVGLAAMVFGYMKKVGPSVATTVLTVILMAVMRDFVRGGYLKDYFVLSDLKVEPQYFPMILFFIVLVIGLAVIALMLKWAAEAGKEVTE